MVVIAIHKNKMIGSAGVTSYQTRPSTKTQNSTAMTIEQPYQHILGPQSDIGPVIHLPQQNRFLPGHTSYNCGICYFIINPSVGIVIYVFVRIIIKLLVCLK